MIASINISKFRLRPEQVFIASGFVVNGGNYLYNLLLGRVLGPEAFADAAVLITLLLVLSFVAMTFQLTVAKFSIEFDGMKSLKFKTWAYKYAVIVGLLLGMAVVVFSKQLQQLFNTDSHLMFLLFGLGIPVYFIMSVRRGVLQGTTAFKALSGSYQLEMWTRLFLSVLLIVAFSIQPSIAIALSIVLSFVAGVFPVKKVSKSIQKTIDFSPQEKRQIRNFFFLTACYECTQIICNNSDILQVKHYFDSYEAGLYASLALIGRVVYFITWMLVMLLLPKVIEKRKSGLETQSTLLKYVGYVAVISFAIVIASFLFPNLAVNILFGEAYLSIAPLLGWYALATSLFAISNIFAYYFLSLDAYMPIVFSGAMGLLQVGLITVFHDSLGTVVFMQIIAMTLLLTLQLGYFFYRKYRS